MFHVKPDAQTNTPVLTGVLLSCSMDSGELGERLRTLRVEAGFTQEELADLAGVARPQLSQIENGKAVPRASTRAALAGALQRKLQRPISSDFSNSAPPTARVVPQFDPSRIGDVIDFTAGLVEVELEAEIACGPPMDVSVKGERVLVRTDGPPPDPAIGEYLVRARGDSMREWDIEDGDYVVIQRRRGVVAFGEIVVAWYDDGLTIKEWQKVNGKKMLLAGSEDAPSFEVIDGVPFEIQGIVRRVLPKPKRRFPRISG